jgi:hypothetical protein
MPLASNWIDSLLRYEPGPHTPVRLFFVLTRARRRDHALPGLADRTADSRWLDLAIDRPFPACPKIPGGQPRVTLLATAVTTTPLPVASS